MAESQNHPLKPKVREDGEEDSGDGASAANTPSENVTSNKQDNSNPKPGITSNTTQNAAAASSENVTSNKKDNSNPKPGITSNTTQNAAAANGKEDSDPVKAQLGENGRTKTENQGKRHINAETGREANDQIRTEQKQGQGNLGQTKGKRSLVDFGQATRHGDGGQKMHGASYGQDGQGKDTHTATETKYQQRSYSDVIRQPAHRPQPTPPQAQSTKQVKTRDNILSYCDLGLLIKCATSFNTLGLISSYPGLYHPS